ncbi:hypothetical protein KBZ12_07120 [Cyanobium sp. Cruz CV13-4-11]|jgi:hypothetical protein|uniref:hypothetical protein n=1 Tax=unclassified Cyanobium TaxID=2627006 RepID=UPI0020CDF07A|nr:MULTISPECIES: hypothetical protein [unclassified Cyanobium]MCP9900094.1 hypothetical protein [Cyanobium sp. Cruz CV11-17]MCP9919258.1 hypothetical protein [Cyanobium sp. Cruz CV13-4-11]
MAATDHPEIPSPLPADPGGTPEHPHNFEAQKEIHRRIRNDPDYDDWEYGTEPLPHEAWIEKQAAASAERPAGS